VTDSTRRGFLKKSALAAAALTSTTGPTSAPAAEPPDSGATPVHPQDIDDGPVGVRPYELDWANRFQPDQAQLVDFEDMTGWRVRSLDGADAAACRSRRELIFGEHTARVMYTGASEDSRLVLEPPEPIPLPEGVDAVDLWVRGNNWGWMQPPASAQTVVWVRLLDADGRLCRLRMGVNNFDYWFLMHARFWSASTQLPLYEAIEAAEADALSHPTRFAGIEVTGCSNSKPAALHFDALSFYKLDPRPLALELPETNDWPTTDDTILPSLKGDGGPQPTFDYDPADGTLSGLRVRIDQRTFQPCIKGGVRFEINGQTVLPGAPEYTPRLVEDRTDNGRRTLLWELDLDGTRVRYSFALETKGKSCVIDVAVEEGAGIQLDIGLLTGLPGAKTVKIPYLTYSWDAWPRVVCGEGASGPIFLLALVDPYRSDASELFGPADLTAPDALGYTGGARYRPRTDGLRNPMRERIFINVSADVQEVLPNIPNPDCATTELARAYLCNNLGDTGYPFPYDLLRQYKAYGIDKYIVNHHENLWRRGGESFTIRDKPAPEIGDEELIAYCAFVRSLGYRLGLYQNFTDLAPVSAAWDPDLVSLDADGSWRHAWPRTYALKPLRAPEVQARYGRRVHAKYGTSASCIDVHTALMPWERTDFDARTPGAGKFRTQFDAYARVLINEGKIHQGPAISEGNYHWFYAGLANGNYATILPFGSGHETPPLVDFDLLKMHTKMTDLGVGSPFCFYGYEGEWRTGVSQHSDSFDRFITATIAYGHIGYLAEPWGFAGTLKCYYLLQALQQRYVTVPVETIAYFDGERLLDTSAAVAGDAYLRGQVRTAYRNGLTTWCNLSREHGWTVDLDGQSYRLPPASFLAHRPGDILAYSAEKSGHRHARVACADYLYLDSRDRHVSAGPIAARGAVAVKRYDAESFWVIPATEATGISISRAWLEVGADAAFEATGYDIEGAPTGPIALEHNDDSVRIGQFPDAATIKVLLTVGDHGAS